MVVIASLERVLFCFMKRSVKRKNSNGCHSKESQFDRLFLSCQLRTQLMPKVIFALRVGM